MLKVQCQEADLLNDLNAFEEDQVVDDYVEEEVDAIGVEDVGEAGLGNEDVEVPVKVPCVCQEVDSKVEHLEEEEETGESSEEDLKYDSLTEDLNKIAEEEHKNLINEEETLSVNSEDENDVLNEDYSGEALPETDATEEKEITNDSQILENENNVTEEEEMIERKVQESNITEENNQSQKDMEENFYDDNIKDIIPEKEGLLKRLTKCFFSRQSA